MKIVLPLLLLVIMIWALALRMQTPGILEPDFGESGLFILLTLVMFLLVSLIG